MFVLCDEVEWGWSWRKGEMHTKMRFSTETTETHGAKKLFYSVSDSEWKIK